MKNALKFGDSGQNVVSLQQYLNCKGYFIAIDGSYGNGTKDAVMSLQRHIGGCPDGIADENMISQAVKSTDIDVFCLAIKSREGFLAPGENKMYPNGTSSWRNNNPGNIRSSSGPFIKFNTYQDGYNALKNIIIRACTGQSKVYNPNDTYYDFFGKYSPSSDNNDPKSYAEEVAKKCQVDPHTMIKNLLQNI